MSENPSIRRIETEAQLEDALSAPSPALVESLRRMEGDILIPGVGGKMGPTLAKMARRGVEQAGVRKRVIGVSRFSSAESASELNEAGIETIPADLLDERAYESLPDVPNVVYMAGRKFGTEGDEPTTWAMNTCMPALVARRYAKSRIVALSTGNVYPLWPVASSGPTELDPTGPIGEYAQSCLGRERIFQYFSGRNGTRVTIVRLNYATELRYGVLLDVAMKVRHREPIDVTMGHANIIWQRDANEVILRAFEIAESPPAILNLAGPVVSIRQAAEAFGRLLGVPPVIEGREADTALLSNGAMCERLFGPPTVSPQQLIEWIAHWVQIGGRVHNLPTHYEQRQGKF